MKPTLVFVYNADGGLVNTFTDIAHKLLSPKTYQCNLCAITHSVLGMYKEWKEFIKSLEISYEEVHRNEVKDGVSKLSFPAILMKKDGDLELLIDSDSINTCRTLDDLKQLIINRLYE